MKAEFWLGKWESDEIGFHQEAVNEMLRAHWSEVGVPEGASVLVPLCGKSLDMCWLAEQGHRVVGLEISPLACEAFFAELGVEPREEAIGALRRLSAGPYRILQGDFFAAGAEDVGPVAALYDRAALVAMPPAMQAVYVRQLLSLLAPGAVGLVNCLEYPPETMDGPPFCIGEPRLRELLEPACRVRRLSARGVNLEGTSLEGRGLVGLAETAYRVRVAG